MRVNLVKVLPAIPVKAPRAELLVWVAKTNKNKNLPMGAFSGGWAPFWGATSHAVTHSPYIDILLIETAALFTILKHSDNYSWRYCI